MASDADVQLLLQAINALYHHDDKAVKDEANKWLESWQGTSGAWQVSDSLLHGSTGNVEVDYFCAHTLKLKVQRDYEELPAGAAFSLRESLLRLLERYCTGSPPVRTQLCLALAALAAHLPAAQWGPGGVVGWLGDELQRQPKEVALPCMLEMLTVLPQEAGSYRPAIRPERRRQLLGEVKAQLPAALSLLSACLAQDAGKHTGQALEAFSAWLKLTNGSNLDGGTLANHPLVGAAMQGLGMSDHSFDSCVEVACDLVSCVTVPPPSSSDSGGGGGSGARGLKPDSLPLAQLLVRQALLLRPRFGVVGARVRAEREGREVPDEGGEHDDDEDTAKGMARLFAELGEAFVALVAAGTSELLPLVDCLLEVAGFPDDTIASMSFNFWSRLAMELTSASGFSPQPMGGSSMANGAPASLPEEHARRLQLFINPFERLVALIRGRVRYSDDYDKWHHDERADFKRARYAIGDTLLDAAQVLGPERTLGLLVAPLQQLSGQVAAGGSFDWRTAEAALYCIRAVHRAAPEVNSPLLAGLFASLPQLPRQATLQYTTALCVGSYSGWFADCMAAGGGPGADLVPVMLQLLQTGLPQSEVAAAAAMALRNVCKACAKYLAPQLPTLMALYSQVLHSGGTAASVAMAAAGGPQQQGQQVLPLAEEDVHQILEAVCLVVNSLPADQRRQAVGALLSPLLSPLQALLQAGSAAASAVGQGQFGGGQPPTGGAGGREGVEGGNQHVEAGIVLVDRISVVFRFVDEPSSVAEALNASWPALDRAVQLWKDSKQVAERASRCVRYALRTAGPASAGLLPLLLDALPRRFVESSGHSCYLFVASEVIKIFGADVSRSGDLAIMLGGMMSHAASALRSLQDFDANPELADDMFLLAGRALSYAPAIVVTPELLPLLLDTAAAGMLVQHREACCSILTFLQRLMAPSVLQRCPREAASYLNDAFSPRALHLARLLLAGITGALPASREQELTDTILAIVEATGQQGVSWFAAAASAIPDSAANPEDRQRFVNAVATAAAAGGGSDQRVVDNAVEELSEVCRRNKRARDAAQAALLPQDLHWIMNAS